MFNKVLISIFFCSIIISCDTGTQSSSQLNTFPIPLAQGKSASAIGSGPDGKIIVLNTGSGEIVKPCQRDKKKYSKRNSGCEASLAEDTPLHLINLIKNSEKLYKVEVIKNGQKVPAQLSLIATITFKESIPDPKEKAAVKKHKLSFLDTIISSATAAETVTQYCTTIFSGGTERQTCISEGNNCELYRDAYGEAVVLAAAPVCAQYF